MSPRYEPITGRYLNCKLLGEPHRLYAEEAGQGIPLLCLHTAGSDGRQFRHHGDLAEPISSNYRGLDVVELPPNNQGVAALVLLAFDNNALLVMILSDNTGLV